MENKEPLSFIDPQLNHILSHYHLTNRLPCLSFGLIFQDSLKSFHSFGTTNINNIKSGPPTPSTLFRSASITKSFTSLMLLKLRDKGILSLDDAIETHLSQIIPKDSKFLKQFGNVKLRNLASHSSGLPQEGMDRYDGKEMADINEILKSLEFEKLMENNEKYHYSNIGYILLGLILEKKSGQRYQDYITKEILEPLGMMFSGFDFNLKVNEEREATGYIQNESAIQEAPKVSYRDCKSCGGLLTCVEDLAKYLLFLMKDNNKNIIASNKELLCPNVMIAPNKSSRKYKNRAYGLGIAIGDYDDKYRVFSHSGGTWGFTSYWVLVPELEIGIILWQNSDFSKLRDLLESCMDVIIPAIKYIKKPKFSEIIDANLKKVYYKHIMGDVIRLWIKKKDNTPIKMDIKENNGEIEKEILLKKLTKNNLIIYQIASGSDCGEYISLFYKEENPQLPESLKFKGGFYNFIDEKIKMK